MTALAHVYIMEDRGAFKVGHSKNPHGRRKQLGAHLTIVHALAPMINAQRVERLAHRLLALAGKRIAGELFSATLDEAKAAIERAERIAAGIEPDITTPLTVKKSRELRKAKKRSLFNMEVDANFRDAVRQLQRLDPTGPSARQVVEEAVYWWFDLKLAEQAKRSARR